VGRGVPIYRRERDEDESKGVGCIPTHYGTGFVGHVPKQENETGTRRQAWDVAIPTPYGLELLGHVPNPTQND